MVDDVKDITENAESKVSSEALDRSRLARERREAEQRKRLDELRAHAAAAQAQREKRDEERRRRQAEQRARDDDRRQQVEERKRAIWEASVSRREALLQREKERAERLERARAARSAPRPAFAFGSSTPRLLEPVDSAGFFWAARSTNPLDQMNFFESLAASTTNVMFASAPLTRRASALQLDTSDTDTKDEPERQAHVVWSSVARRRTDLVPTLPAPRAPGRAYSMTRLDKLPRATLTPLAPSASPSMHHLNRTRGVDTGVNSIATTPSVSRDATTVVADVPRRPTTARKPRPLSLHTSPRPAPVTAPGDGKPPLHRKPKPSKEHDKRGKSQSPGRALSPTPPRHTNDVMEKSVTSTSSDKRQVSAVEVTQKLEALQIGGHEHAQHQILDDKVNENKENVESKPESKPEHIVEDNNSQEKPVEVQKPVENKEEKREEKKELSQERKEEKREEKKEPSQEKTEENEMTASMTARRITTEEEAKAALAERRRRAREELERQAELERQRLQREAEEEAERQRQEEERQRREEDEARELAALQRRLEDEKLRKAIEAQQELERCEAERRAREEEERRARAREEEEKRRLAERAELARRQEAEREERERLARKQRVEAIMARTRLKKQAEEDKKQQENKAAAALNQSTAPTGEQSPAQTNDQSPAQTNEQASAQTNGQAPAQTNEQEPAQTNEQEPAQTNEIAPADVQAPEQTSEKASAQTNEHVQSQTSEQTLAQTSEHGSTVVNDNGTSATSEHVHVPINVPAPEHLTESTELHVPVTESVSVSVPVSVASDNGNVYTADLLQLAPSQQEESQPQANENSAENQSTAQDGAKNNGNVTADLLGLSERNDTKDKSNEQSTIPTKQNDNTPTLLASNGNQHVAHLSVNFIQNERISSEHDQHHQQVGQTKLAEVPKLLDDDFTTHNGHSATHNHPLTLQNAI